MLLKHGLNDCFPVPSEQPQNVYARDKASATEIFLSWAPPPQDKIHGILRGYFIWYSIITLGIDRRDPVFPLDYTKKRLSADSVKDTLINLQTYALYSIKIAAFTSKGHGPIKEISTSKYYFVIKGRLIILRGEQNLNFKLIPYTAQTFAKNREMH